MDFFFAVWSSICYQFGAAILILGCYDN